MSWLRKCGTVSWMLEETRQRVYTRENNRLVIIYIVLLTIYSNILVMILHGCYARDMQSELYHGEKNHIGQCCRCLSKLDSMCIHDEIID